MHSISLRFTVVRASEPVNQSRDPGHRGCASCGSNWTQLCLYIMNVEFLPSIVNDILPFSGMHVDISNRDENDRTVLEYCCLGLCMYNPDSRSRPSVIVSG